MLDELRRRPAAALVGALQPPEGADPRIRPLSPGLTAAGPAVTCRCPPGDNLTVILALGECGPGDVLVVETDPAVEIALFGGLLATWAIERRLGGLVTNGYVRDAAEIRALGFPVWCSGLRLAGPTRSTRGAVNVPIRLGRVAVEPGDLMRADEDGVVVVPRARAREVLDAARAKEENETSLVARLREGASLLDLLELR